MGLIFAGFSLKIDELSFGELPTHEKWNTLLKKHVAVNGDVDYKSFNADSDTLNNYLKHLAQNPPAKNWTKNEKLTYYINLYNAGTVKLILDNYPLKSIKDINSPWGKKRILIGEKKISLGDLEHKILRKMNEPRIHFAINCASYSCPKLLNKAFTAKNLDKQLTAATRGFIFDMTKNEISTNKAIQLSKIFKWYKSDFTNNGSLIDYLNRFLEDKISENTKIEFLDYNWSLNEAK